MRPCDIEKAVAKNIPVLLPLGAVEYHGQHMPIGTDTLIAEGLCKLIAQKADVIVAPAIPFSPTMHWAGGAESGDMDFSEEALAVYALEYIRQLAKVGFRRIYVMLGHQGKGGLPALIMEKAGRVAAADISRAMGAGWGCLPPEQLPENVYSLVRVCDYDEFSDYSKINRNERMPVGHGGRGETQLIMALYDNLVRMEALKDAKKPLPPWLSDVYEADAADGAFWVDFCVDGFVEYFKR